MILHHHRSSDITYKLLDLSKSKKLQPKKERSRSTPFLHSLKAAYDSSDSCAIGEPFREVEIEVCGS